MYPPEPVMDLAHLGHLELLMPRPEESLRFFVEVMGMTESGRRGDSVYPRGWDDYERYSLQLTASGTSGLGQAAFRTRSPQALERRLAALRAQGVEVWAHEGELGYRTGWRFRNPDGHVFELYYETGWYEAPAALRPALKNQAQRLPARGVNVRRLDRFNCLAMDVRACREFFQSTLDLRCTERIELDTGEEAGMWLTATNKSYDFAFTKEAHGAPGRFRHITFALDSREAILAATAWRWPVRAHASCSRPTGRPSPGRKRSGGVGQAWGLKTIESFHTYGTPPLPAADRGAAS